MEGLEDVNIVIIDVGLAEFLGYASHPAPFLPKYKTIELNINPGRLTQYHRLETRCSDRAQASDASEIPGSRTIATHQVFANNQAAQQAFATGMFLLAAYPVNSSSRPWTPTNPGNIPPHSTLPRLGGSFAQHVLYSIDGPCNNRTRLQYWIHRQVVNVTAWNLEPAASPHCASRKPST